MGYQDTSYFVDTSFALGISNPEGFPAYNLIAKAITFTVGFHCLQDQSPLHFIGLHDFGCYLFIGNRDYQNMFA
jgi:hypothetical protein